MNRVEVFDGTLDDLLKFLSGTWGIPCQEGGEVKSALDVQEGGDHYKQMGAYQPWEVAGATFSPEELKGAMKITVLSYLLRETKKGGIGDIRKAAHTMQIYLELVARAEAKKIADGETPGECCGEGAACAGCAKGTQPEMVFDPVTGNKFLREFVGPVSTDRYRAFCGPVAWLYNPWTGKARDPRDIGTDPLGSLMVPPQAVESSNG